MFPSGFPGGSVVNNLACNAGDTVDAGPDPGLARSPGGGDGNSLQYSYLENPMDWGAWWATVHGVAKSWTCLKWLSTHSRALGGGEYIPQKCWILYYLLIYLGLHSVFVATLGLSLAAESEDYSLAVLSRLLTAVASPGAGASAAVPRGLNYPESCGIFLDQGLNSCPLHWQEASWPLDHQGSPEFFLIQVE